MNYAASTSRPRGPSLQSAGGGGDDNARSAADDLLLFPCGFYFHVQQAGIWSRNYEEKRTCRWDLARMPAV